MAFWKRVTKSTATVSATEAATEAPTAARPVEQAVLIKITSLRDPAAGLDVIEDRIIEAIDRSSVGEFDGNEIGPDGATLYLYGPDADTIWRSIDGAIDRTALGPGSHVILRYGPPRSSSSRVDLA